MSPVRRATRIGAKLKRRAAPRFEKSPREGLRGSCGCRCSGPSVERRTQLRSHPAARHNGRPGPAGRLHQEMPAAHRRVEHVHRQHGAARSRRSVVFPPPPPSSAGPTVLLDDELDDVFRRIVRAGGLAFAFIVDESTVHPSSPASAGACQRAERRRFMDTSLNPATPHRWCPCGARRGRGNR